MAGAGIERGVGCVDDGAAAERGVLDASQASTFLSCSLTHTQGRRLSSGVVSKRRALGCGM
jgi:hypothetical protein